MVRDLRLEDGTLNSYTRQKKFALCLLGLVLLAGGLNCTTTAPNIPDSYVFKDDLLVFSIASYFKGDNKSLTFNSEDKAVTVIQPFSFGTAINTVSNDCNNTIVVQNGSLDQIFALCDGGSKVVKHIIDQETFKEDNEPKNLVLQEQLTYPVKCYDMLSTPNQAKIAILCRRTDTNKLVLVEVSVSEHKITASSEIAAEADQPDLLYPGFAVDLLSTETDLEYEVVIFDTQPKEFETSLRWLQRNSKVSPTAFVAGAYFGQKVASSSSKASKLPDQLNSVRIQDGFLRNRQLYLLARNDQVATKYTKCELAPSAVQSGPWELTCAELKEIFSNTVPESFVDIAFSPDVYYSTDESVELALTYIESEKFEKKNIYFPKLTPVRSVETLFFKQALDLKAKTPVISVSGREVLIHATDKQAKTFLMHWKIEREYLSVVPSTDVSFKSSFARQAPTDRRKFEVMYMTANALNYLRVQGTQFKIDPSSSIFKDRQNTKIQFEVADDSGIKRYYYINLKILNDVSGDASLTLNEVYDMYPGTVASIPVSSDRIAGNGASFTVKTNLTNATATIKYAEVISDPTLPVFETSKDAEITYAKNVGGNNYLIVAGTNLKFFECSLKSEKLTCKKNFENDQAGDFKIIDAKKHNDELFIMFSRTAQGGTEPKVALIKLRTEDGSRMGDPVYYEELLGIGALGAIRIFNSQAYLDIIARSAQEPSKFKIFIGKFKAADEPSKAELEERTSLPLHICPKTMVWSPRKEPYLFIESICENGRKEVLEFSEFYEDISTFALAKIYPLNANSKNEMCITASAIVIVDFESGDIFGLVRGASQDTKIAFPFKSLGFGTPKALSCSRYNNFFQVVATSNADNKDYLITYRTNTGSSPNKRVHSAVELKGRQLVAGSKQWLLPSVNPTEQEIFTLALGSKWSDPIISTVVELDVPRIRVSLRDYVQSNGEVGVSITQNVIGSEVNKVESQFKIKVREISNSLELVPRIADQTKVTFERGVKVLSMDDTFYIDGLVINQTLVGDKAAIEKFKLTPRVSANTGNYWNITTSVKECRHSQFNVLFCWDDIHLFVWEAGLKDPVKIPGVYVGHADLIQGWLVEGQASSNYTYLTGLTNKPGDQEDFLFVLRKGDDGKWNYYAVEVNDGISFLQSHLIDAKEPKFAYIAHNPETDSIEAGLYRLNVTKSTNPNQSAKFSITIDQQRTLKIFTDKISHVQSMYLGQMLQVIYHPRNTRDFLMMGISSYDLKTEFEEKIDFGSTATTDSYAEGQLRCSSSYSAKKVVPFNPAQDNDLQFFCSMTTQRYGSIAAKFQLDKVKKNHPKLVEPSVIPNIPGFYPVGLRINNGYTAILKKAIPGYPKDLIPKYLVNETIVVHTLSNGDRGSHSVIPGSSWYSENVAKDVAQTNFGVEIGFENNSTILILTGAAQGFKPVSAVLSPLTLEIKTGDANAKNVKLQIRGLEVEQEVELANHVDYQGYGYLRIVMYAVGVAFVTLILCALSFLCCNTAKSISDTNDKEVTFIDEMDRSRFSAALSANSGSPSKQSA